MNIRQRKAERHKEALLKLSHEGGNKYCFDCDVRGPLYVVSDFNILVCSGCSAVHRSFQHKVKGITMSEFTEDEIARFALGGNDTAEKVWLNTFKGKLPRAGDVIALKDFIKAAFVDRRFCDTKAYAELLKAWEHPQEALATPAPSGLPGAAAAGPGTLAPPPASSAASRSPVPPKPQTNAPAAPAPAPPPATAAPAQPAAQSHNFFDDLFAAPVQAPVMPAAAPAATAPPAPPPAQTAAPPVAVSRIVDDLFAGAPPPQPQQQMQQPFQGYGTGGGVGGAPYPPMNPNLAQPGNGGAPFMGSNYNSPYNPNLAPAAPPQPYAAPQMPGGYSAAPPTGPSMMAGAPASYGNSYTQPTGFVPSPMQAQLPYPQQYPGMGAPVPPMNAPLQQGPYANYGSNANPAASYAPYAAPQPQQQPYQQYQQQQQMPGSTAPPPPAHVKHGPDPFESLGSPSQFANLGAATPAAAPPATAADPFAGLGNPAPYGQSAAAPGQQQQQPPMAWGQPSSAQQPQHPGSGGGVGGESSPGPNWGSPASNTSSSPNRSRIVVLSVTKSAEPAPTPPPTWQ